ncbi:MAG: hypothetical protein DI570_32220, partial [Phenylobacterium zucineum]
MAVLRRALDAVVAGEAAAVVRGVAADEGDPWVLGVAAFAASWALEHPAAASFADRALLAVRADRAPDATSAVLAAAVRGLASAGTGVAERWDAVAPGSGGSGDPVLDAVALLPALPGDDLARFARSILGEAALACGRVALSRAIVPDAVDARLRLRSDAAHPYEAVMRVLAARVAAFN